LAAGEDAVPENWQVPAGGWHFEAWLNALMSARFSFFNQIHQRAGMASELPY
jgi:hypothetical protein